MKNVGIIGCGWLGFTLAKNLIQSGYQVSGTSTDESKTQQFKENNIIHFQYRLGNPIESTFFKNLDYIILSIPVSAKNSLKDYEDLATQIQQHKEQKTNILFTSSISAYGDYDGAVTEETRSVINPDSINFRFEEKLKTFFSDQLTILRLGGLISEDRHPVFHLAGRTTIDNGHALINLVHREDVIQAIRKIIEAESFGEVFNCVYPAHPTKADYYTSEAILRGLEIPVFKANKGIAKLVDGSKLTVFFDFKYLYSVIGKP